MDIEEVHRMRGNWRGRRYLACKAMDDVHAVIDALASDDGSELPPDGGLPEPPSEAIIREMQNMAASLKRLILLHNDGRVSPSHLTRF